ncbi:hypothetical protein PMAYCL1PPCAC_24285 [Pristionchus mayeri]|uniref:RNA-binding protein NOB1 n=1 Tax=Pristionchus mayeri TaxID=1317129 RepID=A0AAN5I7I7_9BILA|nr:hypothetical protein PMAYCL1PPCAC_24285 [Pristionchus mayeri]
MVDKSDGQVKVEHLVLDAGPIIDAASSIPALAHNFYAPEDVINELKDGKTKKALEQLQLTCDIIIREPSIEALRLASEGAKKTGDFRSLSIVDLKVIALTIDLQRENGTLVGETASAAASSASAVTSATHDTEKMAIEETKDEKEVEGEDKKQFDPRDFLPDGFCPDEVDSDDDEGWITEDNVEDAHGMNVELNERPKVACLTTDFALQNVLLSMQLELVSLAGRRVARIQSYVQRCRACYQICPDKAKEFCNKCGNKTLHKCAVSVDANGEQVVHVNWRRLAVTRGLRFSQAAPKGGKRVLPERVFEDQRMPRLAPARARTEKAYDQTFAVHDVTSRAAALGVRTMTNASRRTGNVNAKKPTGKRRGGKQ